MAVCNYCGLEMMAAVSCTDTPIVIRGLEYKPIRNGRKRGRCGDCGAPPGGVHHHGCDMERCPACRGQSISCGCVWAGEEHLSEDWLEELEDRFLLTGPDE
jgi:hypothetical protein